MAEWDLSTEEEFLFERLLSGQLAFRSGNGVADAQALACHPGGNW
jgi:hypothetical protein